jgi:hypothetical protein
MLSDQDFLDPDSRVSRLPAFGFVIQAGNQVKP